MTHDLNHPTGGSMQRISGPFRRSDEGKMVAGLCRSISRRTGWDINLVRAVTAMGAVLTSGTVLVAYLIAWALIPAEGQTRTPLDGVIDEGRRRYDQVRDRRPSAEPGPAPRTPGPHPTQPPRDQFNLYDE